MIRLYYTYTAKVFAAILPQSLVIGDLFIAPGKAGMSKYLLGEN